MNSNRIYFYGFSKLHQLRGTPWNLRGDKITISNMQITAKRMLRIMDTVEVIAVDESLIVGHAYKELARKEAWRVPTEHINFYEFLRSQDHLRFVLK